MKISNFNNERTDNGFTIVELVVVIAGLAALSSISIPSIFETLKLNRVEEVKSIMNSYAADCLSKYREGKDLSKEEPFQLDEVKLSSLGYEIDNEKKNCNHLSIKPLKEDEKDLFSLSFITTADGFIVKGAESNRASVNEKFTNSCRSFAGRYCIVSDDQKSKFAEIAELAKKEKECNDKFSNHVKEKKSGETLIWDADAKGCSKPVITYKGKIVSSWDAYKRAQDREFEGACRDWYSQYVDDKDFISGDPMTPETAEDICGGEQFWFHSGEMFNSSEDWEERDNEIKKKACTDNLKERQNQNIPGIYSYQPTPGPQPCGNVVWLCKEDGKDNIYTSKDGYESSKCYTPPAPPPPPPVGDPDDPVVVSPPQDPELGDPENCNAYNQFLCDKLNETYNCEVLRLSKCPGY